jgi:uncharacterized protein (TIGR03435 family)
MVPRRLGQRSREWRQRHDERDGLSRDLDRPVLDQTGIAGTYKIELQWARAGEGPSAFAAIEEQLGLKLQPSKASFDVLVIDHAERTPAAN